MNDLSIGNVGIITTHGQQLHEITGMRDGLIYCLPIEPPLVTRVCLPDQFWVLLDSFARD